MEFILDNLVVFFLVAAGGATFLLSYLAIDFFFAITEKARAKRDQQQVLREESFKNVLPQEQLIFLSVLSAFMLAGLLFALTQEPMVVLFGALLGVALPRLVVVIIQQRLMQQFENQLVDALTTMSNSLKAGYSLIQAVELVAKEMSPPISKEFSIVTQENRLGVHLDKALMNLARRVESANLDLVVNSITIVRQAGGNLAEVFDTIAETIRERNRLEGKIDSMTAQGRLQGIIMVALPVMLIFGMEFMQPGMFDPLLASEYAGPVFGIVIMLYLVGGLFLYRIVNVDV